MNVIDQKTDATIGKGKYDAGRKAAQVGATSTAKLFGLAGGASLSAGSGIGAAVDVQTYNGHTYAGIADGASLKNASSVTVNADSKEHLTSVAATLAGGAGTFAGAGAAGAHSVSTDTKAYLSQSEVTEAGDVSVTAKDETELKTVAGSGAASGNTGVGLTAAVEVVNKKASAIVGDDVKVTGSSQLSAKTANAEGIAVTASDETTLKGDNGGVSIGISGGSAGAAIGVTNISKDTEAFLGGRAAIDTAGKTKISAKNQESFVNVTVQAAGGLYAGLAGAVNVTNLSAVTKAYTGDDVSFNQADKKGSDVTVEAKHNIDKMTSAGAAVGAGALGAAVDIGTIRTQTNAFLGENNKLHTDGALVIDAADHMEDISTNAIAAAVGGFGVAGSVSVYNFGSIMSDSDIAMLSGKTSKDGGESSMDDWVNGEINKSQTGNAMGVYQTDALTDVKNKLETKFQSETPDMGEKGTLAQIGNGSTVTADNVRIKADDKLSVSNLMGNVSAGGSAAGISVNVVRTDTLTQAKTGENSSIRSVGDVQISAGSDHQMKSDIVGASLSGGISAQGTEETWMDKSIEHRPRAGGDGIVHHVRRTDGYYLEQCTKPRCEAHGRIGCAVGRSEWRGYHGRCQRLFGSRHGEWCVHRRRGRGEDRGGSGYEALPKALGAALGTYAGTGTGVAFSSEVAAKADVGNQTAIHGKNTSITAKNTPTLEARAVSAGLGIAGVGSTVSEAHSKDKALVRVGGGAKLSADEALRIRALMEKPADAKDYNAYAQAIAGAGGVVSGAVGLAFVDMAQETKVSIEASSAMIAKKATIVAEHSDTENVEMDSVSAGGVSGTGGETKVKVVSDAGVSVGQGSTITTAEESAIRAENVTEKAWRDGSSKKNVSSIGAALASGNGVVNETSITHVTTVDLDAVTIKANASDLTVEEKAAGKTLYDKNAIAIDAAHVKNTNSVAATTTAHVREGSQLLEGETEKAKEKDKTASYTGAAQSPYSSAYKGGSIAVGTRNDAELDSDTLVDVYGAAGYAGSENRVTYTGLSNTSFAGSAETAKGDISAMAGRDSRGETGTIRTSAHSDILNATAIPISIKKDPVAKIDSRASLTVDAAANMRSDRDIHMKAKAGSLTALGSGEVKDWVNKVADALGADGSSIGRKEISSSADVTMDGKAETGIHRNKSITIGGQDKQGSWETTVKSDGDISYIYGGGTTIVGKELSERLAALREKLADFGADDSTKAAYEAEIQFLEEKMAA